jgi:hypothetical protein
MWLSSCVILISFLTTVNVRALSIDVGAEPLPQNIEFLHLWKWFIHLTIQPHQQLRFPLGFSDQNFKYIFHFPHACYMYLLPHPPWFNSPRNVRWMCIIKLFWENENSLSLYIYTYGSTALWTLAAFSVSQSYTQSVGLLGWRMNPSQLWYLHTEQHKHRINAHRHPCLEWNSNSRPQFLSGRRRFMP